MANDGGGPAISSSLQQAATRLAGSAPIISSLPPPLAASAPSSSVVASSNTLLTSATSVASKAVSVILGKNSNINSNNTTSASSPTILSPCQICYNNFLDRIALLSPRTWFGVLQSQTQSAFNDFDGLQLAQAVLAIVVPFVILVHAVMYFGSIKQRECSVVWKQLVAPVVFLAPWTWHALYQVGTQCRHLAAPLRFYWTGRMKALPSAEQILQQSILEGRVTRHRRYDVYWPPPSTPFSTSTTIATTTASTTSSISSPYALPPPIVVHNPHQPPHQLHQEAVLLLPGFGIAHVAYSEVARRLSDAGLVVVVASLEPLRIAHKHLGADARSMARLCRKVEQEYYYYYQNQNESEKKHSTRRRIQNNIIENVYQNRRQQEDEDRNKSSRRTPQRPQEFQWNLLGHSAGAFGAMHLYRQFHHHTKMRQRVEDNEATTTTTTTSTTVTSSSSSSSRLVQVDKLILWGCAAMVDMSTDLSNVLQEDYDVKEPKILRIQATQDSLVEMMKPFQEEFDRQFPQQEPSTVVTEWITGGTHQGFASYESTWSGSPQDDTAISYTDQQQQACDLTIRFLLGTVASHDDNGGDDKQRQQQ